MKSNLSVLLYGALFCAVCFVASADAGGGGHGKWKEMMKKCGEDEINIEEAFKGKEECKKQQSDSSRRKRSPGGGGGGGGGRRGGRGGWGKKHGCMMVCTWKAQGVLDSNGKFSESGAKTHFDKVYPEKYRSTMSEKVKACADENSSSFSMDDNCSGYKGFKKCIFKSHAATCGFKMGMGKWGGGGGGGGGAPVTTPPTTPEPFDDEED